MSHLHRRTDRAHSSQILIPLLAVSMGWVGCETSHHDQWPAPTSASEVEIEFLPRTPHIPSYPCGPQCHDERTANPTRRQLTELHSRIHLQHGTAIEWCDFCHDLDHPERLRLMDGTRVSLDSSQQLCSQCHGERIRDFREGLHGSQTGSWSGVGKRRLCTACHDPHEPGAIRLVALPSPRGPERGQSHETEEP